MGGVVIDRPMLFSMIQAPGLPLLVRHENLRHIIVVVFFGAPVIQEMLLFLLFWQLDLSVVEEVVALKITRTFLVMIELLTIDIGVHALQTVVEEVPGSV